MGIEINLKLGWFTHGMNQVHRVNPTIHPLCTLIVFPAFVSICQQWAKRCTGVASAGSLAEMSHLATPVPGAGNNSSVGGSRVRLSLQHKAGVSGWLSAGHRLFLKSSASLWIFRAVSHVLKSQDIIWEFQCISEKSSPLFFGFFFLYHVMAATVVSAVIYAGRAACGKGTARG